MNEIITYEEDSLFIFTIVHAKFYKLNWDVNEYIPMGFDEDRENYTGWVLNKSTVEMQIIFLSMTWFRENRVWKFTK